MDKRLDCPEITDDLASEAADPRLRSLSRSKKRTGLNPPTRWSDPGLDRVVGRHTDGWLFGDTEEDE